MYVKTGNTEYDKPYKLVKGFLKIKFKMQDCSYLWK